jgi:CBS domain-containing protein
MADSNDPETVELEVDVLSLLEADVDVLSVLETEEALVGVATAVDVSVTLEESASEAVVGVKYVVEIVYSSDELEASADKTTASLLMTTPVSLAELDEPVSVVEAP